MTTRPPRGDDSTRSVIEWLLDSDPSIRWQTLRDLTDASDAEVARERAKVATEGWGARLLDVQDLEGTWGGAAWAPGGASTTETLVLLRHLGLDPISPRARRAIGLVRDGCTWGPEFGDNRYFDGEVEPCINGRVLASGAYFGEASTLLVDRLLGEQLDDGGWNCNAPPSRRSSFHSTICVLEGLLEYEQSNHPTTAVSDALHRGQEYLLERSLFRSRSSGAVIDPDWSRFSFPTYWHYDVLRGLDHLRKAGVRPDNRVAEAIGLVEQKRADDGRWPLESFAAGPVHFAMEDQPGEPSRWNTLRALGVLAWSS